MRLFRKQYAKTPIGGTVGVFLFVPGRWGLSSQVQNGT